MSERDQKLLELYRQHFKPVYGKPVPQNSNGFGIGKKGRGNIEVSPTVSLIIGLLSLAGIFHLGYCLCRMEGGDRHEVRVMPINEVLPRLEAGEAIEVVAVIGPQVEVNRYNHAAVARGYEPIGIPTAAQLPDSIEAENVRPTSATGIGKKDYEVQSVLFKRPDWSKKDCDAWLKKNGFRNQGVDEKPDHYRYRQIDPHYIESKGYTHYVTKKLPHSIDLIIAYKGKKGGMIVRSFPERSENHF
jgi:hypothetical protein